MKDPSVNIKMSDLLRIVQQIGWTGTPEGDISKVNEIFRLSQDCRINRNFITTDKKTKTKIDNALRNTTWDKFQYYLLSKRQEAGHKYIRPIDPTSKQWSILIDVSNDAEEFANLYQISIDEACQRYIEIGLNLIGKNYRLSKFKYYKNKIFDRYRDAKLVMDDPYPQKTKEIYEYYMNKVNVELDFNVNYVHASEQCMENGGDVKAWVDAQFDGLQFLGAIPEPYQLHGEGALGRYQSYAKVTTAPHWSEKIS